MLVINSSICASFFLLALPLALNLLRPHSEGEATDFMDGNDSYQLRSQMEPVYVGCFFIALINYSLTRTHAYT